jgi:hypothetical protein
MFLIDTDEMKVLGPTALKEFLVSDSVESVTIMPSEYDLIAVIQVASRPYILGRSRGGPRLFKSIDGAAATLKQYGIDSFDAKLSDWIPKTEQRKTNLDK